ncbi:MAG: hypothetical protein K6U74_01435 [Firmicutes bacterium]|nr:hypothetical protein [Bacillota bacterium]
MVKTLKRTDLDYLKKKHTTGKGKNRKLDRDKLREELIAYYKSEEGQRELKAATRVTVEHHPNFPLQDQPVEVIVDMIMQEFD